MHGFLTKLPVFRAYIHNSIPYHVGSVWGNQLGLQVFRTASQYLLFKARPRSVHADISECVKAIETNGIATIENFLEPSHFAEVRAEFDDSFKELELRPYKNATDAKLHRTQITLAQATHGSSKILEYFQRNDRLNRIASAIVRRKISRPPDVHLDWYQGDNAAMTDNDVENILHADLHTTTIKMFFYLEDVDETNGAFVYAKGSHRLTLNRLRHEYELSVRQAKLRKGMPVDASLLETRGNEVRNVIHPRHRQLMEVKETQMCVRANTLVIANNMGFHRRGEFLSDRPRKSVQINYRFLEKPFAKDLISRNAK